MEKAILITGATRGLGLSLARWMAAQGWMVYGCGRDKGNASTAADQLGDPHRIDAVDVTDSQAVQDWVRSIYQGDGPKPNRVVNNAGLINQNAPLWEVPAPEFFKVIETNVMGPFNLIRAVVPELKRIGGGVIVNLSSGWGRSVSPEVAPYCASKWAIEGLTQALAQELPDGIAAYALNPGIIDTEMLRSCFGAGASSHMPPDTWAEQAGPRILGLSKEQESVSISI